MRVRDNIERVCCDDPDCPVWGDEHLVELAGLSIQDLNRIRDAANLIAEKGFDDDLAADLDLIGDRVESELKLRLDAERA